MMFVWNQWFWMLWFESCEAPIGVEMTVYKGDNTWVLFLAFMWIIVNFVPSFCVFVVQKEF